MFSGQIKENNFCDTINKVHDAMVNGKVSSYKDTSKV